MSEQRYLISKGLDELVFVDKGLRNEISRYGLRATGRHIAGQSAGVAARAIEPGLRGAQRAGRSLKDNAAEARRSRGRLAVRKNTAYGPSSSSNGGLLLGAGALGATGYGAFKYGQTKRPANFTSTPPTPQPAAGALTAPPTVQAAAAPVTGPPAARAAARPPAPAQGQHRRIRATGKRRNPTVSRRAVFRAARVAR